MTGGCSFTAKFKVVGELPPLFVAVIVYVVFAESAVGVPAIPQFVVLKVKPAGSNGLILHEVGDPPAFNGKMVVIARLIGNARVDGEKVICGALLFTVRVRVFVALPPLLEAVMT